MLSTKSWITTLLLSTMAMVWTVSARANSQQEPMTAAETLAATMQGALDDPLLIWLARTAVGIFALSSGHFALRWASRQEPKAPRSNSHHRYLRHHH